MNEWKQAFWLATFELRTSIINIVAAWIVMTFFSLIFFTGFGSYIESNYISFDIFFVLGLSYIPFFFRSKHYQYQKLADGLYGSPTFIMMTQLPIPKKVLVKSRLIITFVYVAPFMLTVFPIIYLFIPGVSEAFQVSTYITFWIISFSLVLICGMTLPASDPGDKVSSLKMAVYFVVTFLIFSLIFMFFYRGLGYGIVAWLIQLAEDFGWIAAVFPGLLVVISWIFGVNQMQRKAKKLDYM